MSEYSRKLNDPRWKQKRLEIIERAGGKCEGCGRRGPLEVHHCAYLPGREPWDYDADLLMAMCRGCHEDRQKVEDMARIYLGRTFRLMGYKEVEEAAWDLARQYAHIKLEKDWAEYFS